MGLPLPNALAYFLHGKDDKEKSFFLEIFYQVRMKFRHDRQFFAENVFCRK